MNNQKRRYVYGIATALMPLLVVYGIIEEADIALWVSVLGAILIPQLALQNTSTKEPKRVRKSADE